MDACEIANFLASELFMYQFVNDGGYNSGTGGFSGVPTRTTSTLTPTTLRNIEQTFQDLNNDYSQSAPYSAGFVPPPAPTSQVIEIVNTLPPYQPPMRQQQSSQMHQQTVQIPTLLADLDPNSLDNSMDSSSMSESSWQTPPQNSYDDSNHMVTPKGRKGAHVSPGSSSDVSTKAPRRNAGGRKPSHHSNCTPEEEAKRRVRRERNKLAAARCRKRREDHTSELQDQVDELEAKKGNLTAEIQEISQVREELLKLIEDHRIQNNCVISSRSPPDVKPAIAQNNIAISTSSNVITTTAIPHIPISMQQSNRPTSFVINNNNNNMMNANNKLSLKIIKQEPEDEHYDDEPPRKRRCDMVSGQEFDITTPTTPYMPQLTTPTFIPQNRAQKPSRPSSLNVPPNHKPSDFIGRPRNVTEMAGISVNTPSNGMFNFDSLMEGGTGLTPVTVNPLVPCSTQNRNPMDMLQTPTSEPSKLCSL